MEKICSSRVFRLAPTKKATEVKLVIVMVDSNNIVLDPILLITKNIFLGFVS